MAVRLLFFCVLLILVFGIIVRVCGYAQRCMSPPGLIGVFGDVIFGVTG